MRGGGPICIITASGMICEAASYHRPWYDGQGYATGDVVSQDSWSGLTVPARIAKLKSLAGVGDDELFMIIKRPVRQRSRAKKKR